MGWDRYSVPYLLQSTEAQRPVRHYKKMTTNPEFTVFIETFGDNAEPETFEQLVESAERNGFDGIVAGDHITHPEEIPETYPFSPDGTPPSYIDISEPAYDVFQTLAYITSMTSDLWVGTNICVAPYRHPITLTKHVMTLCALSDNKFELGVAPGWMRTEFEALDVPFEERGSRTDEFLHVLQTVRGNDGETDFEGEHFSFEKTGFHPLPDGEWPRIWIGGHSGVTFRRTAEYGDGWVTLWDSPEDLEGLKERLMNAWRDYDRDGKPLLSLNRPVHFDTGEGGPTDRLFTGDPSSILADVEAYKDVGVDRFVLDFYVRDPAERVEQMELFNEHVISEL